MNHKIIRKPVVTEKTIARANSDNVYTFEVSRTADKNAIKAAIEETYGVTVLAVNNVMRPKTLKRTGQKRLTSLTPKTKKALIKLKNGETIALFDVGGSK
ncbi:MAG: 50S ribosomal protein L23 [Candidatus Pacebacteria bacterium GW2011_GWB1_47_8]|nr:MAG: 50S ribosomal protein L23 [Candidatus Pacebacteria bacterium GW2011_GWA1_46_10]KKU84121.1 MAG: 50S ribosomal protein L23 [Candidatus Pacebacteria bacterium GW2011_GWB1_47_8]HCR80922.1 50S ribosomal protein L23 [Candidatus Paceibacterota bacterium]